MYQPTLKQTAVIGCGVIGRGWIVVFARAGCKTGVYDPSPDQRRKASEWLEKFLETGVADGLFEPDRAKAIRSHVVFHRSLEGALLNAEYVQESGPENTDSKKAVFQQMDSVSDETTIIASSTSTLDINSIAGHLKGAGRCFTAHPFNPPYVLPAVEMMATRKVDMQSFTKAIDFLKSVGQRPIRMNYFVPGYLANRIQAALVRECIHLVEKGVADVEAVDAVISDALGLRWALLGNFGTNHTNADGGVREYYSHYGKVYAELMSDLDTNPPAFHQETIDRIGHQVEKKAALTKISDICRWRDRMVLKIRKLKSADPAPGLNN